MSSFRSAESMKGGGYTDTMECGSAVKSNELSSHKKTGMTLKCTWLSDRRKPVGNLHAVILVTGHSGKDEAGETASIAVDKDLRSGGGG